MNNYIDVLIFDRTAADVQEMTDKAYIDYNDLNRVENAIKWISYTLNRYGYRNTTHNKVNWKPEDRRTDAEMDRLRRNLITIRTAYCAQPSTPNTPEEITYTSIYQANFIEKIISDIGKLVEDTNPITQHLSIRLGSKELGNRSVKP